MLAGHPVPGVGCGGLQAGLEALRSVQAAMIRITSHGYGGV